MVTKLKPDEPVFDLARFLPDVGQSSQTVNTWHFRPLFEALVKEGKSRYTDFKGGFWTVKAVLDTLNALEKQEEKYNYADHGVDTQVFVLYGNERWLIFSWNGSQGKGSTARYLFSFDSWVSTSFLTFTEKSVLPCYFLWCAAHDEETATLFFVPTPDLADFLEISRTPKSRRISVLVKKEQRYWWVKKVGPKTCDIDAEKWQVEVRYNEYDRAAARILNELDKLPKMGKI